MPQVVDLANLKKPFAEEATETDPSTQQSVKTALLVIQNVDGSWTATPDLSLASKIEPQSVPDGQDMIAGLNIMLSDIQAEKTANMTLVMMNQMAQQQMAAMSNAQIASQLNLKH